MNYIPILIVLVSLLYGFALTESDIDRNDFTFSNSSCSDFKSCDQCSKTWACNWCETEGKCVKGQFYGPGNSTCTGWRWRQCKLSGLLFLILVGSGAGLALIILITLICCCCCKCCCKKSPKNDGYQVLSVDTRNLEQGDQFPVVQRSTSSLASQRRQEMYSKYNIKS